MHSPLGVNNMFSDSDTARIVFPSILGAEIQCFYSECPGSILDKGKMLPFLPHQLTGPSSLLFVSRSENVCVSAT